jgi:biopolymer transport protein ExbD
MGGIKKMTQRRKRKKTKYAYKRFIVLGLFILLFASDVFNFSWFKIGQATLNSYMGTSESATYTVVMVQKDKILWDEKEMTYDTFKETLNDVSSKDVIIHLIDSSAYTDSFTKVHQLISNKGYRMIVSERIPSITYLPLPEQK